MAGGGRVTRAVLCAGPVPGFASPYNGPGDAPFGGTLSAEGASFTGTGEPLMMKIITTRSRVAAFVAAGALAAAATLNAVAASATELGQDSPQPGEQAAEVSQSGEQAAEVEHSDEPFQSNAEGDLRPGSSPSDMSPEDGDVKIVDFKVSPNPLVGPCYLMSSISGKIEGWDDDRAPVVAVQLLQEDLVFSEWQAEYVGKAWSDDGVWNFGTQFYVYDESAVAEEVEGNLVPGEPITVRVRAMIGDTAFATVTDEVPYEITADCPAVVELKWTPSTATLEDGKATATLSGRIEGGGEGNKYLLWIDAEKAHRELQVSQGDTFSMEVTFDKAGDYTGSTLLWSDSVGTGMQAIYWTDEAELKVVESGGSAGAGTGGAGAGGGAASSGAGSGGGELAQTGANLGLVVAGFAALAAGGTLSALRRVR